MLLEKADTGIRHPGFGKRGVAIPPVVEEPSC